MATLAAYPAMMRRSRQRLGLRECRAAWLIGVTVRQYREIEAGERETDAATWERMCEVFGWQVSYWPRRRLHSEQD
jgi:helix-turn-helix protein